MVSAMPRQLYPQKRAPVPIVGEVGWALRLVWTGTEKRNLLHSLGLEAQAIQAVVSHSTEYAVLSPFVAKTFQHPCHSVCLFLSCFPYLGRK